MKQAIGIKKYIGLMFLSRRRAEPLEFKFDKDVSISIHSVFVFFPFKAIWFNAQGNIIEERIFPPFQLAYKPKEKFRCLMEIPL